MKAKIAIKPRCFPNASMATSGRGTGMVGYNVQAAVDTQHHLIVTHEVTNLGHDRTQLSNMSRQAKEAIDTDTLDVVADRGYFKGEEILACDEEKDPVRID